MQSYPIATFGFPLIFALSGCGMTVYLSTTTTTTDTGGLPTILDTSDPQTETTGSTSNTTGTSTSTTSTSQATLSIDSINPDYGSNGGGNIIYIDGGPFDASAVVTFGGIEAELKTVTEFELSVELPSSNDEGFVNVAVTTDEGTGSAPASFFYWPDASGKKGLWGIHYWFDYVGNYWADPQPVDAGFSQMVFIDPSDVSEFWEDYSASMDSCSSNYTPTSEDIYILEQTPDTSSVSYTTPNGAMLTLPADAAQPYLYLTDLSASQYQAGDHSLNSITAPDWPEFELDPVLTAPSSFSVTNPNLAGGSLVSVSRNNFQLQWSGAGLGDYMVFLVDRWEGATVVETVTCAASDTGLFTIPSGIWSGWSSGQQLSIMVVRATVNGDNLPFNNAETDITAAYIIYGAALTQ